MNVIGTTQLTDALVRHGHEQKQIVALATEIISLVTTDIGDSPLA